MATLCRADNERLALRAVDVTSLARAGNEEPALLLIECLKRAMRFWALFVMGEAVMRTRGADPETNILGVNRCSGKCNDDRETERCRAD